MSLSDENNEAVALLDEEETLQLEKRVKPQRHSRRWCWWTTLNTVLLVAFSIANLTIWSGRRLVVWRTDFPDARKAIQYEERVFTGALTYDQSQRRILRIQDAEIEYFGRPSFEIDQAWEELLHAGEVDSIEDFKKACKEMNETDRKRHEEEEEKSKKHRKGRRAMCCNRDSALGSPTINLIGRSSSMNKCEDVEG
ncbi:uncharacterized protein yc1106_08627 [Curvularia clavata]|uniref:Uncharacterized protein n=1 Tax=Curvularia clavata TaxID=95742 RepID=A0A9Q9DUS2_CURCL|nr:uncharacterized protein yc1106_08627 [Curvularia clavata]